MTDTLSMISLISFIVSGISLLLAIFFWIKFRIPKVIGDLSGRTARKSIAKMRANNEKTGNKSVHPSAMNISGGGSVSGMNVRSIQDTDSMVQIRAGMAKGSKGSSLGSEETVALGSNVTELLYGSETTSLLEQTAVPARKDGGKKLTMLEEVVQTHTDEVIE